MRLKIPICVLILFLNLGRRYQTTNLKPHYSANFTTVPFLTVHHNWRCSGVTTVLKKGLVVLRNVFILYKNKRVQDPHATSISCVFVIKAIS